MKKFRYLKVDSRNLSFPDHFGATTEFVDESHFGDGVPFIIEQPGEIDCTALSAVKVAYSQTKNNYDVNILWNNTPHTDQGADPKVTIKTAITYGLFNLATKIVDKIWSSYFVASTGSEDPFDNCRSSMTIAQSSCTVASYWYRNWTNLQALEVMPQGDVVVSDHDWVFLDWVVINGSAMAKIDAHMGYPLLMPREVFNMEVSRPGCAAYMPSSAAVMALVRRTFTEWLIDTYKNLVLLLQAQLLLLQK